MLSIIIPTYNEEDYVGKLLQSLCEQTYKDFEVIVVDASDDKTLDIVNDYISKLKITAIKAGRRGVAHQNNAGAKQAQGDILLFLGADIVLKNYFLERALREFLQRNLQVAGSYMRPIAGEPGVFGEKRVADKLMWQVLFNLVIGVSQYVGLGSNGSCIFCKKSLHNKISGFDPTIKLAEDFDYTQRASRWGKFRILRRATFVSMRRADVEGRLRLLIKLTLATIHKIFLGNIRSDVFKYEFGHYKKGSRRPQAKLRLRRYI